MSDVKHTPGPWRVKSRLERQAVGAGDTNVTVAWCGEASSSGVGGSYFVGCEECEANARLISAAPDLLEACEAALRAFDGSNIRIAAEYAGSVGLLRAAIAKATQP